jgi:glutaminyl-peptide cyclotransferase
MLNVLRNSIILTVMMLAACSRNTTQPVVLPTTVVSTRPHDPGAYTQGLQLLGNRLFESTGLYGKSSVREIDPATGTIKRKVDLPATVFGEGLTVFNDRLYVLTWREQKVFVINPETFSIDETISYPNEGWGLTSDGKNLILSDGSSSLKIIEPENFTVLRHLSVTENGQPLMNLNELEFVDGYIYANIYQTDRIVKINARNGKVIASLDLSHLRQLLPQPNNAEVLNGIAFDQATGNFIITGKNWPMIFEISLDTPN